MNDRTPERPLQPRQPQFDESVPFDEFNNGIMHDVLGNERLAKPVQQLLISLYMIEQTQESFGADSAAVVKLIIPQLEALRAACRDEWKDM